MSGSSIARPACRPRRPTRRRSRFFCFILSPGGRSLVRPRWHREVGAESPASIESKTGLSILDLTRFLDANRFPPRIKSGAGFHLKTLYPFSFLLHSL